MLVYISVLATRWQTITRSDACALPTQMKVLFLVLFQLRQKNQREGFTAEIWNRKLDPHQIKICTFLLYIMISGYKGSTINGWLNGWLNKLPFYSVFTVSKSIVSKISKHDKQTT